MGGEGGGVLADWIVDLAEQNGYLAQATSVPGVAQRTGATIYYVELFPLAAAAAAQAEPVLALMPMPGDVDIVLASELMEAARAVQRGLVTPERTTLIASTHRVWSIAEKTALGDGRVDGTALAASARAAAARCVAFDMAALADAAGSVISAVLFGALAGSGALPFAAPRSRRRSAAAASAARRAGAPSTPASRPRSAAGDAAGRGGSERLRRFRALGAERGDGVALGIDIDIGIGIGIGLHRRRCERRPARSRRRRPRRAMPASRRCSSACAPACRSRRVRSSSKGCGERSTGRTSRTRSSTSIASIDCAPARPSAAAPSHRDGAAPRALDDLRGHDSGRRPEDARRRASIACAPRCAQGTARCSRIDEYLHPRLQEICDTLPAGLGRWLEAPGRARRPRRALDGARARRHDELALGLPPALRRRRAAPLSPPQRALRARETGASTPGSPPSPRRPRATRRWPSRSRSARASSRATARRTSAAGATSAC